MSCTGSTGTCTQVPSTYGTVQFILRHMYVMYTSSNIKTTCTHTLTLVREHFGRYHRYIGTNYMLHVVCM